MSQFPSRKEVERIKKMYPKGTRIQIERMNDPYHPIERGTKGTVDYVDDIGTLHVSNKLCILFGWNTPHCIQMRLIFCFFKSR